MMSLRPIDQKFSRIQIGSPRWASERFSILMFPSKSPQLYVQELKVKKKRRCSRQLLHGCYLTCLIGKDGEKNVNCLLSLSRVGWVRITPYSGFHVFFRDPVVRFPVKIYNNGSDFSFTDQSRKTFSPTKGIKRNLVLISSQINVIVDYIVVFIKNYY